MILGQCGDCSTPCLSLTFDYFHATQRRHQRRQGRQGRPKLTIDSLVYRTTLDVDATVYLLELLEGVMADWVLEETRHHYYWLAGMSLAVIENPQ